MAFPNRRPGSCSVCGTKVGEGAGLCYKDAGRWLVVCASSQCQARALGESAPKAGPEVRELRADGTVVMPFDREALPLIKGMPGARWNPSAKVWTVSTKPADRIRVLEVAARLGLSVAPELAVLVADDVANAAVERARLGGAYPFQLEGVRWIASHATSLVGDDMGLGKTAQTLWALDGKGAIVVCPKSLKLNWRNECRRWRPDLEVVICNGRGSLRAPAKGEVVIANFEILPEKLDDILDTPPCESPGSALSRTTLVVDEAHRVKSHKAKRTKAIVMLREACARCVFLTGTPLLGRPFDLYGVLNSGGMAGETLGGFKGFLRLFGGFKNKWGGYEFGEVDPSVPERLRRVMIRRTKAEVLPDLPKKTRSTMVVNELPAALRRELDAAYDAWYDLEGGEPQGLPDFREFSELRAKLAASRIDAAVEWCEDREEEGVPVLVFSAHRKPVETIGAREGWGMILGGTPDDERQALVDKFQRGELKGLALTIMAGGVGITLTRASTALFVDSDWTPGNNLQAEDRMVRIGQTASSVQIVRLVSDHVLDAHVLALLDEKTALIEAAIERVVSYEPKAPSATTTTVEESEAVWLERMAAREAAAAKASAEADRKAAMTSVERKVDALVAGGARLPKDFTEAQAEALRGAIVMLRSMCDGARMRDDSGFNRPDAAMGHWLAATGMQDTASLQLAWAISRKYVGQVGGQFPAAFPGADRRVG